MSPEKLQICHLKRLRRARQVGGRGEKVNPEKIWELTQKPLSLRVNPGQKRGERGTRWRKTWARLQSENGAEDTLGTGPKN